MDSIGASVNPCTDIARKMSKAHETLATSQSQQERASALNDFETLKDAIAEMQFFSGACVEPDEDDDQALSEFQRDLGQIES